jgi:integrase
VDRYKSQKVKEGKLGAAQINKTLKALAMILDAAIEYGVIDRANPARGRRRRVKVDTPTRTWVEPEQLMALLESAPKGHRAVLATLAGAGLRVGEACALLWRDLDLSTGTLTVRASKTNSGRREVDLPQALVNELWTLAATSSRTEPDDPVFVGTHRTAQTPANVARRLKTAIKRANVKLEAKGIGTISERVTPHSLRRTYASLRYACGDDVVFVAEQGGWSDPSFPIRVYARSVRRRQKLTGDHLEAFDAAIHWAALGSEVASESHSGSDAEASERRKTAP